MQCDADVSAWHMALHLMNENSKNFVNTILLSAPKMTTVFSQLQIIILPTYSKALD